ncbi:MAG TPA: cytochrome c oxidase subunit 4 [Gaiellaceae bacterium]|nr:cytochrome c oxidase subunit 4 [Gaiellaceae bacterium]
MEQSEHSHAEVSSLWPIGVAVGVAFALVGLLVSWWIVAVGAAIVVLFGVGWIYEVVRERRPEPEPGVAAPAAGEQIARASIGDHETTRTGFLSAMTLGLGAAIGALVTIPAAVFTGLPPFKKDEGFIDVDVDLGPLETFSEGEWLITQFNMNPALGDVAHRTAYVRYNGLLEGEPSFTILSNRCVHLGCPVQANGPTTPEEQRTYLAGQRKVTYTPVLPAGGFGCPCHGGQYDSEGNRTAGPPVRALDRWAYRIADGRLRLIGMYSVNEVDGSGQDAAIGEYRLAQPGVHVDGVSQILYPFIPPS